jgi:hypothetical protein
MRILYNDLWKSGTLTANSEATGYLGVNTQHPHLSKAWNSTGIASEWVKIDAGAAGISIDSLAIVGHNFTPAAVVSIQGNAADAWGAPTLNLLGNPADQIILVTFPLVTFRWWRVLIADPANTNGYLAIGRVYACARWEATEAIDNSFKPSVRDTTKITESITGQVFADLGVRRRIYGFSLGTMKDATKQMLESIALSARNYDPVIVDPSDLVSSQAYNGLPGIAGGVVGIPRIYAKMNKQPSFSSVGAWGWTDDGLEFEEAL